MLTNLSGPARGEPSESELRKAADRARAAVAAAPEGEAAVAALREAVQRYAKAFPRQRREIPEDAPAIRDARQFIAQGALEPAEVLLREHLAKNRNDPPAMHMMAEIAALCDLREDAERILKRSGQIHADSARAMADLGMTMHRIACQKDIPEFVFHAAQALDQAIELDPANELVRAFKASMMMQTRNMEQARTDYEALIELNPHGPAHWLNYGYLLKTFGEFGAALAAYRTALSLAPEIGTGWWALADLKGARMFPRDIEEMEALLDDDTLSDESRVDVRFALAQALDKAKEYERAIFHLEEGSALRRRIQTEERDVVSGGLGFVQYVFTREFFAAREGWGDPRPGPIFIVGMHRAGSTLVEQILSSHPDIEGTEELFILHQFAGELDRANPRRFPFEIISDLGEEDFRTLGERYFEISSRSQRTDRPFFTDKNPANWRFLGLIHCMLPNAKIIDVRRNPMDCCFANYTRHYRVGVNHSYSLAGMGQYYREYVGAMRHFDEVLPGRIHRVIHDDLVDDLEGQVRRLLDYIGLPFDERCLRFFETERAVHTPSSGQVREPINRKGFGRWRSYEPWLGELKEALGETLEDWR
ncbi:MAG TPA: sulfotransferase [Sphingomicrobium sp.]|nr:sulfotransferase [Sphingomicrobium sp.]